MYLLLTILFSRKKEKITLPKKQVKILIQILKVGFLYKKRWGFDKLLFCNTAPTKLWQDFNLWLYFLSAKTILNRARTVSAAKVLLNKYPNAVGNDDLESSSWAKILYQGTSFVQRKFTSTKVDIPEEARKKIEY